MPFRALNLSPQIMQAVQEAGYTEPTPIQVGGDPAHSRRARYHRHRADRHGKDSCFRSADSDEAGRVPIRTNAGQHGRGTRALVVAPTRELVVQIEENVRAYAKHLPLRMATVFGGVSERPQIEALRSGVDLVVATPGRLIDLMGQRACQFFRHRISRPRRSRPDAGHGFSSADPPDREGAAAKAPDAHVLRLALARDRTIDPRVPTVAEDC